MMSLQQVKYQLGSEEPFICFCTSYLKFLQKKKLIVLGLSVEKISENYIKNKQQRHIFETYLHQVRTEC